MLASCVAGVSGQCPVIACAAQKLACQSPEGLHRATMRGCFDQSQRAIRLVVWWKWRLRVFAFSPLRAVRSSCGSFSSRTLWTTLIQSMMYGSTRSCGTHRPSMCQDNRSAVYFAATNGKLEALAVLRDFGADLSTPIPVGSRSANHVSAV